MMITRDPENNSLRIEDVAVAALADTYSTPCYVYSREKILENVSRLRKELSKNFKRFRIQYPLKANSNPHLLRLLKDEGLGADCSSPAEIMIARRVGFPMQLSSYTGNYESPADLEAACASGMVVNLDDDERLEEVLAYKKPELLSFRINPGLGRGGFEGIVTGGTDAKFGIPYERTRSAYQRALKAGIRRFGIHMMTGSNILEPLYFAEVTQKLLTIAGEALADLDIEFEFINIGGGLGIPYTDLEQEIDLEHTFKLISESFHENVKKYRFGDPELVVEPGRYLVGNAGVVVSRVTHVKNSYRLFLGLDAGMNTLLRPSLYRAYHRILVEGKSGDAEKSYLITGQVCENSDIHPGGRPLPEVQPGDIVVILDTGAYGFAMSSNYNNRPRPAEILVSGHSHTVIRRAETWTDLLRYVPEYE